jgi:hypothetical protein
VFTSDPETGRRPAGAEPPLAVLLTFTGRENSGITRRLERRGYAASDIPKAARNRLTTTLPCGRASSTARPRCITAER